MLEEIEEAVELADEVEEITDDACSVLGIEKG